MDESEYNNVGYSGYYPHINNMSNYNLPEISKTNNNYKKTWLKYNYRFIISVIIFIICTSGYAMNQKGILNITDPSKINQLSENEFNITKFLISNNTCKNYDLISPDNIKKYFEDIGEYKTYKKINNCLSGISFITSLIIVSIIYYINFNFVKEKKENKYAKIISFILATILLINEFIIFIIDLALFMRLYEIIIYIQKNIDNKCIIILTWDYTIKLLKHLIKTILILSLFKICNMQLIVYFLKQLIVMNNFFNYEDEEEEEEEEEIDVKNNIELKKDFSFNIDVDSIKQ